MLVSLLPLRECYPKSSLVNNQNENTDNEGDLGDADFGVLVQNMNEKTCV